MNVLITGASRGIGFALAGAFLHDPGNRVVTISRSQGLSHRIIDRFTVGEGSGVTCLEFDLLDTDYKNGLVPMVEKEVGKIDVVVNNSAALVNKPFEKITDKEIDQVFDLNVKSPFRLIRDLLPLLNTPSHIVNISSMGGVQGSVKFPGLSLYSTSKGALAILTECLAAELSEKKISVNALALGAVQTEMLEEAFPGYKAPLKPDEMAGFIKDFCYNGLKFFNGKILPVSLSTP